MSLTVTKLSLNAPNATIAHPCTLSDFAVTQFSGAYGFTIPVGASSLQSVGFTLGSGHVADREGAGDGPQSGRLQGRHHHPVLHRECTLVMRWLHRRLGRQAGTVADASPAPDDVRLLFPRGRREAPAPARPRDDTFSRSSSDGGLRLRRQLPRRFALRRPIRFQRRPWGRQRRRPSMGRRRHGVGHPALAAAPTTAEGSDPAPDPDRRAGGSDRALAGQGP